MDSTLKGAISEAKICASLLAAGYLIVLPGSIRRWDLGWEEDGKLIRVQCKTGKLINGAVRFNTSSRNRYGHCSYHNQIDYFAVYEPLNEKIYLVPIDVIPERKRECWLRIEQPKNGQEKGVLWAHLFEFN